MAYRDTVERNFDSFFQGTVLPKTTAIVKSAKQKKFQPGITDQCISALNQLIFLVNKLFYNPQDKKAEVIHFAEETIKIIEKIKTGAEKYISSFQALKEKLNILKSFQGYLRETQDKNLDGIMNHPVNQNWKNTQVNLRNAVRDFINSYSNSMLPVTQASDVQQFHNQFKNFVAALNISNFHNELNNIKTKITDANRVPCPQIPQTTPQDQTITTTNQAMVAIHQKFIDELSNLSGLIDMTKEAITIYRNAVEAYYNYTD